jgi:DNA-binding NarL/FixJ family response regulator
VYPVIRIIVIDEHTLVRERVSWLLAAEPDMRVVGSFDHGSAAVRFAAREAPEVAIIDIAMPDANGIDVARRLRAVSPKTQLLMLSTHARGEYVQQALWAGASGYVLKEAAADEVAAAVRAVHAGQRYLSSAISARASSRLMTKLDIENLPALVKFAVRRGLTGDDGRGSRRLLPSRFPFGESPTDSPPDSR